MKIIAPTPKGDFIATMHKPLGNSDSDGYISLGLETALPISNLTELLKRVFGLKAECIGPGGIGRSPTLVETFQGQFWLLTLNTVKLKACEGRAIKPLITAGHIDPRLVRIAHRMPQGWTPPDTMREVGREVFLGHVEPGSPSIAVGFCGPTPTKAGGQTWVNWVVIDVSHLHLPG